MTAIRTGDLGSVASAADSFGDGKLLGEEGKDRSQRHPPCERSCLDGHGAELRTGTCQGLEISLDHVCPTQHIATQH
jgi:hypothetical protein